MAIKNLSAAYDELRRKIDAYDDSVDCDGERKAAGELTSAAELVLDLAGHSPAGCGAMAGESLADITGKRIGGCPCHAEVRLPDGTIVDRDLAQIIGRLRASGVETVECCADGWRTGMAYVILHPDTDIDRALHLLGHKPHAAARAAIEDRPHRGMQAYGPWFRSDDGWALGAVNECETIGWPAIAWPVDQTPVIDAHIAAATALPPFKLVSGRWTWSLKRRSHVFVIDKPHQNVR